MDDNHVLCLVLFRDRTCIDSGKCPTHMQIMRNSVSGIPLFHFNFARISLKNMRQGIALKRPTSKRVKANMMEDAN